MRNNNLQDLELFSPEKLVKEAGEQLPPRELAILARIVAANSPGVLDEVPPFSKDILDQLRQMDR